MTRLEKILCRILIEVRKKRTERGIETHSQK